MIEVLNRVQDFLLKNDLQISGCVEDQESEAYSGCSFQMGNRNIQFRKAKSTPKKNGLFVTLWKRNNKNETEPYSINDHFDFYMIMAAHQQQSGFFFFPKQALIDNHILTSGNRGGKRGFRVYHDWDSPQNGQAEKTQAWQTKYFIDLTGRENLKHEKFCSIFNSY